MIPDDPAMAATTRRARTEINDVQGRMAEAEATQSPKQGQSNWVTSEKCASCHQQAYDIWKKTRHSHAFAALKTKNRLFDAACVGCHSVGYGQQGFVNLKATPQLANVQCESCHGPGADHLKAPGAGNYKTPATPASCIVCHDRDNSPDFVFDKYWPVIAHGANASSLKKGLDNDLMEMEGLFKFLPAMMRFAGDHDEVREQSGFLGLVLSRRRPA